MAEYQTIRLATKPTAQLHYRFYPSTSKATPPSLLVFLNGLMLPQDGWSPAIEKLQELQGENLPAMVTYDRFGQGRTTDRDPQDEMAFDPSHGHDCIDVVGDLRQFLSQVVEEQLSISDLDSISIIIVANSIGCALARLYAQEHPGTVAGLLLLDSIIANTDFVSIFPDPDAPKFDPTTLPEGVTPEGLRDIRALVKKIFHPSVGNNEGLSRKNLASLLPDSNSPKVLGPGGRGAFVTIVGHDFETFASESEKSGWPRAITMEYANPYWHEYNKGLVKITEPDRAKGPVQAPHAGHFIQRDNPEFVAEEVQKLLERIE